VPESTLDRLVLALGVCALAGLVALIVPAWREYSGSEPSGPASPPPPVEPATSEASRREDTTGPSTPPATTATTTSPARKPAQPRAAKLTLLAAKGDCWVEARSGSASGRLLYLGTLPQGRRLTLPKQGVWLRLGAAHNLAGWIGSKPVRNLPRGAATVVATPAGIRTLALG
jgi:hypothetical protein